MATDQQKTLRVNSIRPSVFFQFLIAVDVSNYPQIGSDLVCGPITVKANSVIARPPPKIKAWVKIKIIAGSVSRFNSLFKVLPITLIH